jgi:hypothetical protein
MRFMFIYRPTSAPKRYIHSENYHIERCMNKASPKRSKIKAHPIIWIWHISEVESKVYNHHMGVNVRNDSIKQ